MLGRMRGRSLLFAFVLPLASGTAGCEGRKLRYDDLDLAPARAAFQCAPGLAGDRGHACRMLDEYAAAERFATWPAKGLETWYGRKVCSDAIDSPDRIDVAQVHLSPGPGKAIFPADVKTDPSKDVPYGAQFIATSASSKLPGVIQGYRLLVQAAESGTEPQLAALSPEDRELVVRSWESSKRPPGTVDFWRLDGTDGKSIRGAAFSNDVEKGPSASYFLRGASGKNGGKNGGKMLLVWTSNDPKVPWCVGEAWRIFVAP